MLLPWLLSSCRAFSPADVPLKRTSLQLFAIMKSNAEEVMLHDISLA